MLKGIQRTMISKIIRFVFSFTICIYLNIISFYFQYEMMITMDLLTIICIKNVICLFYFGFEIIFYYKIEKALLIIL